MKKPANSPKVLVRAADLAAQGYTRFQIPALLRRGELTRMSRGLYYWTNAPLSAHSTIASVGKLVPNGIICLLTALRFHEIGTQNPGSVWVALPSNYKTPKLSNISISAVHFGTKFSKIGVAVVAIDGVSVKITNPARTVVDCFRFGTKSGLILPLRHLRKVLGKELSHPMNS